MRALVLRLASVVLGVALALAAAELGVRVLGLGADRDSLRGLHVPRPDRPWLYGLRPGADVRLPGRDAARYRINADGHRGPRAARPRPERGFRIAVLGDSVAFGHRVDESESFPRRLEAVLNSCEPERPVEVVNLGVGGYNAYNEARLLADLAPELEPDLVLVQFCINDLNDPTQHFDSHTRLVLGELPEAAFPNPATRRPTPPRPSVLARACGALRVCALLRDRLAPPARPPLDAGTFAAAFAPLEGPGHDTEWRWLRERYREIAEISAGQGAEFAVVAFPYKLQLERSMEERVPAELARIGDEEGWTTIDLLPAFRRRAARGGAALLLDLWHPSAAGHELAAREIARELVAARLVPVDASAPCPR